MDDTIKIEIETLGEKGDGIGRMPDGARVHVPGALPGEVVMAGIAQDQREGIRARLIEVVTPAPGRVQPPCAYFGRCGGCALQHMAEPEYIAWTRDRVLQAMSRAGLEADMVEGPLVSPAGSRRRAVLSAKCDAEGAVHLGFNERGSHALVEIEACTVLLPVIVEKLAAVRALLAGIMTAGESYDIALTGEGGEVDLLVTVLGKAARDCPVAFKKAVTGADGAGFARVSWQANRLKPPTVIFDSGRFRVRLGDLPVDLPPGGFLQATAEGEAALTGFAVDSMPGKKAKVVDLYAGSGTFTFALLAHGCRVDAFEGDPAAVAVLQEAGRDSGRIKAARRDLFREPLGFQELQGYDVAVIDPPRLGAESQMREIVKSRVNRVVSISCNPDTFARDGAILAQKGFSLTRMRIVDQFLWSPHIEVAGLFVRG